jgi:phosphohistidine phosphatase
MHRLHLLRHANSRADDAADDRQRPLSRRGRADARGVAETLPAAIGGLDLVLCSTALRTRETAALVLTGFAAPPRTAFEDSLYLAPCPGLIRRLQRLDETEAAVLLIGHNPGLHELALALADMASPRYRALASGRFPTAALASFAIETAWAGLDQSRHRLCDYVTPASSGDPD